jgi:hypothetical protein
LFAQLRHVLTFGAALAGRPLRAGGSAHPSVQPANVVLIFRMAAQVLGDVFIRLAASMRLK